MTQLVVVEFVIVVYSCCENGVVSGSGIQLWQFSGVGPKNGAVSGIGINDSCRCSGRVSNISTVGQ